MGPKYYNIDGEPLELFEWAELFEIYEYKMVGVTYFGPDDSIRVSTTWLGLNHNYGAGPPLIFETMIFGGEHNDYMDRYSTLEEAKAGHEVACNLVRESVPNEEVQPNDE